jgi:hypothetical protein
LDPNAPILAETKRDERRLPQPPRNVWGLQAKFFHKLGASERAQLTESVRQAAANYPSLERYTICLPFNLTARKGVKAGNPRSGTARKAFGVD